MTLALAEMVSHLHIVRLWPALQSDAGSSPSSGIPILLSLLNAMAGIAPAAESFAISPDLAYLLTDKGVSTEIQAQLAGTGFSTLRLFALMADERKELRAVLADDPFKLSLDAADLAAGEKIKRRVAVAQLTDAWLAANTRVAENNRADAEQRATGVPLTLPGGHHVELRSAYEAKYTRVTDREYPADALVERRLQEVDQGDLRAESLQDVSSRDDMRDDPQEAVWFHGAFKVKRSLTKIALPSDSEALRRRVKLLGMTFTLARIKNPSRAWLATAVPGIWLGHLDYVLGDTVYGFSIKVRGQDLRPPWEVVLSYEHEIRKEATRGVLYDGLDLATALNMVQKNTEHRERFFVTPCVCVMMANVGGESSSRAGRPPANSSSDRFAPYPERNSKKAGGKQKGRGKGKGGKSKDGWHSVTSENRPICYRYNTAGKSCSGQCGRAHCCQICFGKHPVYEHDVATPAAAGR